MAGQYRINVPDESIKALKGKLTLSLGSLPGDTDSANDWNYGAPLKDVRRLAERWKDGFDWRAQEAKINEELPQFKTTVNIDGFGELKIHFVHKESSKEGSIPLLFCHGWPGSFLEVAKILPLLTEPDSGPSFHVVAPSLPNFGFSDAVQQRGFGPSQYAETMHKVMLNLGYSKYVTQGGDLGFPVTRFMGIQYPESCLASHINFIRVVESPKFTRTPLLYLQNLLTPYSAVDKKFIERTKWFQTEGFGYQLQHATRPSTIGFALMDPVALLAWIYEKLHDWTDNYPWMDDEILTWVSVYQFSTATAAASVRIYYERRMHSLKTGVADATDYVPSVPLGLSYFHKDVILPPKLWGRALGPVVFERQHERGGHFAAHEQPELLVADVREMFECGAAHIVKRFRDGENRT